jgi:hypothetical protein
MPPGQVSLILAGQRLEVRTLRQQAEAEGVLAVVITGDYPSFPR